MAASAGLEPVTWRHENLALYGAFNKSRLPEASWRASKCHTTWTAAERPNMESNNQALLQGTPGRERRVQEFTNLVPPETRHALIS